MFLDIKSKILWNTIAFCSRSFMSYLRSCPRKIGSTDRPSDIPISNNIFIDDDYNIVSVLDWQHSEVLPLFLHAGIPGSLQNYGDPESEAVKKPEIPDNLHELSEIERQNDMELYRRRHAHFYYIGATSAKLEAHYRAMAHDTLLFRKKMYAHASEPWEGNSIPLKADLVQAARLLPGVRNKMADADETASGAFAELDGPAAEEFMDKLIEQEEIDARMRIIRDIIGVGVDGWVPSERYDEAVAEAQRLKGEFFEARRQRDGPGDDGEALAVPGFR